MSKNLLTLIMETNKFNGMNYNDWLRIRIVLNFENYSYVLDKQLPIVLLEGSSLKERITFEKWLENNRKVRSIILASMTNDIQKQYDRLDDVLSIMLRVREVYAVPDRHIRYTTTKIFFGTKMIEVLVGEASTSKKKGKRVGRWKRKKGKGKAVAATAGAEGAPAALMGKGKGKGKMLERSKMLNKDEMILRLGNGRPLLWKPWDLLAYLFVIIFG
ncbi:UNVERIFIED_CONTAM: hypothetical protein Sradi_5764300 [Sesamum radiatum]|uniref:Uncharacterized protein n=1 Tax=Sesamum radiatum TaxID=300843 RepID=A0AAW2L2W4_SESRA